MLRENMMMLLANHAILTVVGLFLNFKDMSVLCFASLRQLGSIPCIYTYVQLKQNVMPTYTIFSSQDIHYGN